MKENSFVSWPSNWKKKAVIIKIKHTIYKWFNVHHLALQSPRIQQDLEKNIYCHRISVLMNIYAALMFKNFLIFYSKTLEPSVMFSITKRKRGGLWRGEWRSWMERESRLRPPLRECFLERMLHPERFCLDRKLKLRNPYTICSMFYGARKEDFPTHLRLPWTSHELWDKSWEWCHTAHSIHNFLLEPVASSWAQNIYFAEGFTSFQRDLSSTMHSLSIKCIILSFIIYSLKY